ncbi:MAG: aminodeoxychorismate/anthranilate synthase component II [Bacteroidetes bacterium]|nr:aminodeoxychorismate/anthranilate synthase component II [Bacteroidota bacterium]
MRNILLIDNFDSFTYNLVQLIRETKLCKLTVMTYDKVDDKVIESCNGFVMSPGPGIPSDFPNLQYFVERFHQTKSILGVCMGYEAIGMAFGAELYNLGTVFHGVSRPTRVLQNNHSFLKHMPLSFQVGLYHSWTLSGEGFPDSLEILAKSTDDVIMVMAHRQYHVVGVQFHPESIMTEYGSQMMHNWIAAIP